ncbi:unnamed protein product, partial [marine sediment metagenome]
MEFLSGKIGIYCIDRGWFRPKYKDRQLDLAN